MEEIGMFFRKWVLTILILFETISASNLNEQTNTPVVYNVTGCASTGGLWYIIPSTIENCIATCVRQMACKSVSYNRGSALCVLRDSDQEPVGSGNCYHIVLRDLDISTVLGSDDPCVQRPCDNRSMCQPGTNLDIYICTKIYCDKNQLPTLSNGQISSTESTKINTTNAYQCITGYTMFGDSTIRCLPGGTWSSIGSTCYKDCPSSIQKVGATIQSWSGKRFCYNTTVTYTCNTGYYTFITPIVTCTAYGTWSPFQCFRYCSHGSIPSIENGVPATGNQQYAFNETARYTCNNGYYLSPEQPDTLQCFRNGTWQTPTTMCWKYCGAPSGPAHAVIVDQSSLQYTKNQTVSFTCFPSIDYYPTNSDTSTTCKTDGTWSPMSFSCNKYCGQPPLDSGFDGNVEYLEVVEGSGKSKYTAGDSVKYGCKYSYHVGDNDRRYCQADGTWSGSITCCIPFVCCTDGSCSADVRG